MARYITALLCVSVVIATLSYVVTPTTADDTSDSAAETNGYLLHINQVCHPHLIAHCKRKILKVSNKKYSMHGAYIE